MCKVHGDDPKLGSERTDGRGRRQSRKPCKHPIISRRITKGIAPIKSTNETEGTIKNFASPGMYSAADSSAPLTSSLSPSTATTMASKINTIFPMKGHRERSELGPVAVLVNSRSSIQTIRSRYNAPRRLWRVIQRTFSVLSHKLEEIFFSLVPTRLPLTYRRC